MMMLKILRYFFVLLPVSLLLPFYANGQALKTDSIAKGENSREPSQVRGIQFDHGSLNKKELPLFAGVAVGADVVGPVMASVSPFGQLEAMCRVYMKGTFFPVFEAGWGLSNHTDETTNIHYKTGAPFFRIGCDYNFARDKHSGNRILGGLRYGFSSFNYDVDGPAIIDPVWGSSTPFNFSGLRGSNHWAEVVFGLEAKIWGIFHLGWSFRYRLRLSNKQSAIGDPWYVPGYGRNDSHSLGGTLNLVFDVN